MNFSNRELLALKAIAFYAGSHSNRADFERATYVNKKTVERINFPEALEIVCDILERAEEANK